MSKQRQIGVTFTSKNIDLLGWIINQAEQRPMPVNWFVIEAIKAYRYLLEKYGPDWKDKI